MNVSFVDGPTDRTVAEDIVAKLESFESVLRQACALQLCSCFPRKHTHASELPQAGLLVVAPGRSLDEDVFDGTAQFLFNDNSVLVTRSTTHETLAVNPSDRSSWRAYLATMRRWGLAEWTGVFAQLSVVARDISCPLAPAHSAMRVHAVARPAF